MRLTPDQRYLIGKAIDRGINKNLVARVFGISRPTVYKWDTRRGHLKDRRRKPRVSKVTEQVELSIIAMRTMFEWGTARIQQGLISLPDFMKKVFVNPVVQGFKTSRTAINEVLKRSMGI
jgi:hypothetical protein